MTDVSQKSSATAFRRVIRAAVVLQVCLLQLAVAETASAQDGPLGQFLKDLFGPGEAVSKKQDLIDRHAASASRELHRTLEQIESHIATRQWDAAIRQLQFVIDLPEDALIQKRGVWVSIKRTAEQRLLTLPEDGRRAYLNQYAEAARDDLARARSAGDFAAISRVASRFRVTPAGQSAADEVASLLADSGDLVSAARWSLELSQDGVDVASTPESKARLAAIWQAPGRGHEPPPAGDAPPAADPPQVSNRAWTELYGGPGRWNAVAADQPLLFEEWSSKSTELPLLQEELGHRQADLFAGGHHPIPVANAVAADGRMAVRGVSGLEVRTVSTGRLLWQARGQSTIESQYTQRGDDGATGMLFPGGENHDSHPLSSFLYRDAAIGQLSTDGRRLYAISRKSTLLSSAYALFAIDSRAEDTSNRSFNSLVAIDFATGRNLWTIGGSKDEAPFESPLAGVYFFGPPTVDGDELFVIGAAGADLNLYCLEASTGLPKWQQFIAQYDTTKIEDDFVRQMWSCTPAVTRGTIYCPTGAGWLVAVDRLRHRLAWSTRYSTAEISDRYQPQYSLTSLGERWTPTVPFLAGGTVIFAPPELPEEQSQTDAHLFRIDAVTGKILFKRGKAESIAVLGVYGENVLILGETALEQWPPLALWGKRWTTPYPDGLTPCGTGVAINGVYWLPFFEGAVVGFRLSNGRIEKVLRNEALAGRLGNLIVNEDRVLSTGPTGIVALWQKTPFETLTAQRLAKSPRDLESRLRQARSLFSQKQADKALAELEAADRTGDASLVAAADDLEWQCLFAWFQNPESRHDVRWKRLETLSRTPARHGELMRLEIDRAIAHADWRKAIDLCWAAIDLPSSDRSPDSFETSNDAWLAGRLLDVWNDAPDDVRKALSDRIASRVALEGPKLTESGPRAEILFGFHPLGRRLSLALAKVDVENNEFEPAESRLALLMTAAEPETVAAAGAQLADLYAKHDCPADAAAVVEKLRKLPESTPLDVGTLGTWLASWKEDSRQPASPAWMLSRARVIRMGADSSSADTTAMRLEGRPASWLAGKRLAFADTWQRLVFINRLTGRPDWTVPLANSGYYEEATPQAMASGSLVAVCSPGMLHVCSPKDRRILWNWPLPPRFAAMGAYAWAEDQLGHVAASTPAAAVNNFQMNVGNLRLGPLMAIAGDRLVLLGQKELIVFDLRTGQEQWRRQGIAPSAVLTADDRAVCVSETTAGGPAAYRLLDGKPLESGSLQAVFARAFAARGEILLTRQGLPALFSSAVRLVAEKPASGEALWSHSVSAEALMQHLPGRELAVVEPAGNISVIDIDTGLRTQVGKLTAEQMKEKRALHVVADADRVYVALQSRMSYDFPNISIPSITVNGELVAFDRREGRLLWRERLRDSSLLMTDFADSPVVLLADFRVPERRRRALDSVHLPELKITAIDKTTGSHILDWSGTTLHGSPGTLVIDPLKQRVDVFLSTYNQNYSERLRLQFGDSPPTSVP